MCELFDVFSSSPSCISDVVLFHMRGICTSGGLCWDKVMSGVSAI